MLTDDYKNWPESMPLTIAHGSGDPVTSHKASKELVEKTKATDKEYKEFDGLYHECWHEKGDVKIEFINHYIE
jgi:acylglycerol lipase